MIQDPWSFVDKGVVIFICFIGQVADRFGSRCMGKFKQKRITADQDAVDESALAVKIEIIPEFSYFDADQRIDGDPQSAHGMSKLQKDFRASGIGVPSDGNIRRFDIDRIMRSVN